MGAFSSKMGKRFSRRWADDAQTSLTDGVPPESEIEWQYDALKLIVESSPPSPSDNYEFAQVLKTAIALCPELVCIVGQDQTLSTFEFFPIAVAATKWFEAHRTPYVLERRGLALVRVGTRHARRTTL